MNDRPSRLDDLDDGRRSSSPKRKKVRQKYAPKACVSCRRSKLKCSGDNPCQRCRDSGKRCFYSEDQTAAEALQNLSRPSAHSHPTSSFGNGSSMSRATVLPGDNGTERGTSDANVRDLSMEARMARIESIMDALLRDRELDPTPRGSVDRGNDTLRNEVAFTLPLLDPINPALAYMGNPASHSSQESPVLTQPSMFAVHQTINPDTTSSLRIGNRLLRFPSPLAYQQYLQIFFSDLHLRYPCIDEADFRAQSERSLAHETVRPNDIYVLALSYIMFACCDALLDVTLSTSETKPPGWHWFQLADDLVDKKSLLSGRGNLTLIRVLLYQALYFSFVDLSCLAYNTIGLASRLVFQHQLHQQPSWATTDPDLVYTRICVFWNVLVVDRSISISCGRPYTIREADVQVDTPIQHDHPASEYKHYVSHYLNYTTLWARSIGHAAVEHGLANKPRNAIDIQINAFLNRDLPELRIPYSPPMSASESVHRAFISQSNSNHVLWLHRPAITSLQYDNREAAKISDLALSSIQRMRTFAHEARNIFSYRHQMVSSLSTALLVFCSLIVRGHLDITLPQDLEAYVDGFRDSTAILQDLAYGLPYARRVLLDFKSISEVVENILNGSNTLPPPDIVGMFPYTSFIPPVELEGTTINSEAMNADETYPSGPSQGGWDNFEPNEVGSSVLWF